MRRYFSIICLGIICILPVSAQNLVPNGSMEIKTECPESYGYIKYAEGWFETINSPDYYNACNKGRYTTLDSNLAGKQMPFDGKAYSALVTKNFNSDYHEHQGIKLTQPLVKGQTYTCRLWVSLTEMSSYASNKMGFQFSTKKESEVNNISQVYTDEIIRDKKNWVLVSGSFVADQAYTYVFVGNFFEDKKTQIVRVPGGDYDGAYYYVDSISVTPFGSVQVVDVQPTSKPGIFNVLGAKDNSTLVVTRASGEAVYSTNITTGNMNIDLTSFGHDTYCVLVESAGGDMVRKIITY